MYRVPIRGQPCLEDTLPTFEWNSSYSVNVSCCDDDHKKLFALIGQLRSAMQSGKGARIIERIVKELEHYSIFHFSAEEALMAGTHFSGLALHRIEHQTFIDRLAQFRREGITNQSIAILNFMNDWLVNHINITDKKYSAHLNANGIS